jgi:hypothetical protein
VKQEKMKKALGPWSKNLVEKLGGKKTKNLEWFKVT